MPDDVAGSTPSGPRTLGRRPCLGGVIGGAIGYANALTPSLLPTGLTFLLLLTALGTIVGYAIGSTIQWALLRIPVIRRRRAPRWLPVLLVAVVWIPALAFTPVAIGWQYEQQAALAMPEPLPGSLILALATLAIAALMLLLGRSVRAGSNALARLPGRWIPIGRRWMRLATAVALVVLSGLALSGIMSWLVSSYDVTNADTSGQSPTGLGINSGSADSLTPWGTLGREGRFYVGNTMAPAEITGITGRPAQTPVRVYVGMEQGDTPQARTSLALAELDRVDAWSREYLVIFGVTGTGWVDPNAINALEAVTDGDVTTVAVQYSAVPSWIGFVIDPQTTVDQNKDTIDAVVAAWREKPAGQRPELILFGESLGSLGTQGAWTADATPEDVVREIPHVIWMGPPAESVLWKTWQADRSGGPAWEPIVGDGTITRVLVSQGDPDALERKPAPTIVFAAHANDPVVYWSPDLLLGKPDWLDPPLGPGVMPQMRWIPFITFLQVGMGLISGGEPPEVGHNYSASMALAIALAVQPDGWTTEQTLDLQAALPEFRYETS